MSEVNKWYQRSNSLRCCTKKATFLSVPFQLQWISIWFQLQLQLVQIFLLPFKENLFAKIWWEIMCEGGHLHVKGFDARPKKVEWIDGRFGFDKGRMLWLPPPPPQLCLVFARRTSLLTAIRSGHNSISLLSTILGNTLAPVFLLILLRILPPNPLLEFCSISKQSNWEFTVGCRAWDSRHHNGAALGVSGVTGALRLPAGRRIILPHTLHKKLPPV